MASRLCNVIDSVNNCIVPPTCNHILQDIIFVPNHESSPSPPQKEFLVLYCSCRRLCLLLVQGPLDRPPDALAQAHQRLVAEPPLRLGDVIVPRHAAVDDALAVKGGGLAHDAKGHLAQEAEHETQLARHFPDVLGALVAAGGAPDGAGEVPKVDRLAIRDEERLAVDALVVEGNRLGLDRQEQGARGEEVRVGHVLDVGEVKHVGVGSDLHARPALLVNVDNVVDGLDVALAKDARRPDRGGEEVRVRLGAVGGKYYGFCFGLEDFQVSSVVLWFERYV